MGELKLGTNQEITLIFYRNRIKIVLWCFVFKKVILLAFWFFVRSSVFIPFSTQSYGVALYMLTICLALYDVGHVLPLCIEGINLSTTNYSYRRIILSQTNVRINHRRLKKELLYRITSLRNALWSNIIQFC
jgi:hypothetical protein